MPDWPDWRQPFRVDECDNKLSAALLAPVAPGLLLGLAAATHELATNATGYSVGEIVFAYFFGSAAFGVCFAVVVGLPYVLLWDRFVAGPRWLFVAIATVYAATLGMLLTGVPWVAAVLAVGGGLMAVAFVSLLVLPEEPGIGNGE